MADKPTMMDRVLRNIDTGARSFANTVTFGGADWIAGRANSLISGGNPQENVEKERQISTQRSVEDPVGHFGGAVAAAGTGAAAVRLISVKGVMAAEGGLMRLGISESVASWTVGSAIVAVPGAAMAKELFRPINEMNRQTEESVKRTAEINKQIEETKKQTEEIKRQTAESVKRTAEINKRTEEMNRQINATHKCIATTTTVQGLDDCLTKAGVSHSSGDAKSHNTTPSGAATPRSGQSR
ncbi:MAG: hypothetical protein ACK52W_06790 [Alphaproteobacteria bacterium]